MELMDWQLGGLSRHQAECFGKPHWKAGYSSKRGDKHRIDPDARCLVCGAPADSAHHEPPKGMGGGKRTWTLITREGNFILRPALIALCGNGTMGCHGMRHSGLIRIRWVWDVAGAAHAWWDGELLRKFGPHSPLLYGYGHWEVER